MKHNNGKLQFKQRIIMNRHWNYVNNKQYVGEKSFKN